MTDYWFNIYNIGEYQELHNHISLPFPKNNKIYHPVFSLIYILNDESNQSSIAFRDFQTHRPFCKFLDGNLVDTGTFPDIKEGVVIAFPLCLDHMEKPATTNGCVTIAFNMYSAI